MQIIARFLINCHYSVKQQHTLLAANKHLLILIMIVQKMRIASFFSYYLTVRWCPDIIEIRLGGEKTSQPYTYTKFCCHTYKTDYILIGLMPYNNDMLHQNLQTDIYF